MTIVLGINSFTPYIMHDSAATIVKDGKILASVQEERLTGIKHDRSLPLNAIKECMKIADVSGEQIDAIAVGWELNPIYKDTLKKPHQIIPRLLMRKINQRKIREMFNIYIRGNKTLVDEYEEDKKHVWCDA